MNKFLFISIAIALFTGCHENHYEMPIKKESMQKAALEMITKSFTTTSTLFKETYLDGSEIGLYITYGNEDSLYKGTSLYINVKSKAIRLSNGLLRWTFFPDIFLTSNQPVRIYAYSPYKKQKALDPASIPIHISPIATETPSYKYGRLSSGQKEVSRKSPLAKLSMNYALSLLSFKLYQHPDIKGSFKLTSIQIGNRAGGNTLQYNGTMDIVTGDITGVAGPYKATLLTIAPSATLRHSSAEEQTIRIVPTYSPIREKEVEVIFTINGNAYKYIIPKGTCWKKGHRYMYTLYFDGNEIKPYKRVPNIFGLLK